MNSACTGAPTQPHRSGQGRCSRCAYPTGLPMISERAAVWSTNGVCSRNVAAAHVEFSERKTRHDPKPKGASSDSCADRRRCRRRRTRTGRRCGPRCSAGGTGVRPERRLRLQPAARGSTRPWWTRPRWTGVWRAGAWWRRSRVRSAGSAAASVRTVRGVLRISCRRAGTAAF